MADLIRPDLGIPDTVQEVLGLLLSGDLPDLASFDEWWAQIVGQKRQQVKSDLVDEFGMRCECCAARPGFDLHELVPRSSDTTWRQIFLFTRENCALICRECHEAGLVHRDEFKEKIERRRKAVQG